MTQLEQKIPAAQFLPHKPPMVLLDSIVTITDQMIETEVSINRQCPFADYVGNVPVWIGIEYMAQSIAALSGVKNRNNGLPVQVGLLLGTRQFISHKSIFPAGSTLRILAESQYEGENSLFVFQCVIYCDGILAAEAVLTTFKPSDEQLNAMVKN